MVVSSPIGFVPYRFVPNPFRLVLFRPLSFRPVLIDLFFRLVHFMQFFQLNAEVIRNCFGNHKPYKLDTLSRV